MMLVGLSLFSLGNAELRALAEECYGMAMAQVAGIWTREMVLALPDDGNRYELFDGELLVTPSPIPRHQIAVQFLSETIAPYVRRQQLGMLMLSPADLDLGGDQLSQPDVFVLPQRPNPMTWRGTPNPIL